MEETDTDSTPDKPEGSEQHPPDGNPERQGPEADPGGQEGAPAEDERPDHEPPPESGPGEPGVPAPRR